MEACIEWTGYRDPLGYGHDGHGKAAHRIAWEARHGVIPAGMVVRHDCDNPSCVNVNHLRLGTHADNVADRVARGRSASRERNGRAKLTAEQAAEVRARFAAGEPLSVIAAEYGIDRRTVRFVGEGYSWRQPGEAPANPAACHPDRPECTRDGRCRPCYLRGWKASRAA